MYEASDKSEEEKQNDVYRNRINSDDASIIDPYNKNENSYEKANEQEEGLDETSLKMTGSESQTQIDPIEKKKKFNIEEVKYPLNYKKYLKVRETNIDTLIKEKVNCFGNFGVSLFWEEKIILFIRYLQLWSLTYIAFIEYWPFNFNRDMANPLFGVGFNFIYLEDGFYKFIEKYNRYAYNIVAWILMFILVSIITVTIVRVKKFRHEFKHSKTLFKKWSFNLLELLYIPMFGNLIPFLTCDYITTKNGFNLHK